MLGCHHGHLVIVVHQCDSSTVVVAGGKFFFLYE
jgi:hypothetical protein